MQKFYNFLSKFEAQIRIFNLIHDQNSAAASESEFIIRLNRFMEDDNSKLSNEQYINFKRKTDELRQCFNWEVPTKKSDETRTVFYKFSKQFSDLLENYRDQCEISYQAEQIFKNFNKKYNHNSWDDRAVNEALYCLLYISKRNKIENNVLNLLSWIIQTKNNLEADNFEKTHFLLQYMSRDINTDQQKGGNGKSFIVKAIAKKLADFKDLAIEQDGAFPTDKYVTDKYSKYWFIFDTEMDSLSHLNKEKTKAILSENIILGNNKFEKQKPIRIISNFIGCSNEDWTRSEDKALGSRVLQITADSRLNLRNSKIRKSVEKYLPSVDAIGTAFLYLLGCPLEKLMELREKYQQLVDAIEDNYNNRSVADNWVWDYYYKWFREFGRTAKWIRAKDIVDQISKTQNRKPSIDQIINILLKLNCTTKGKYDTNLSSWKTTKYNVLWDCSVIDQQQILDSFTFEEDNEMSIIQVYNYFHKDIDNTPDDDEDINFEDILPVEQIDIEDIQTAEDKSDEICGSLNIPQPNRFCQNKTSYEYLKQDDGYCELKILNPIDQKKAEEAIKSGELKTGCGDITVASRRNFVFQMDDVQLEKQKQISFKLSKNVVNQAVFSGGKSIHNYITINREPESKEEYEFIWNKLNQKFFEGKADTQCKNPARRCRLANALRNDTEKIQERLFKNNNILYCYDYFHNQFIKEKNIKIINNISFKSDKKISVINNAKVQYYLNNYFFKKTGNGNSNNSFWTAICVCVKANDEDTLQVVCDKARSEHWSEKEIQKKISDAHKKVK